MKKVALIINIICMVLLISLNSCKKQLQETPHSFLVPQNFYQTGDDANTALNGVFSILQEQGYYQRTVYLVSDMTTDIFYPIQTSGDRADLFFGTYNANNSEIGNWWGNNYIMIKNANDLLTYVPPINMDEAQKNNILGNAYFLRALAYFDLTTSFGDVPLVLTVSTENLFPARTSSDSVYAQVIDDLKFAEANCLHAAEISDDNIGRVSSEAASTMLARVYLQRSSTTFADASDNQNALDECNKVISYSNANPGAISLNPVYANIFNPDTKNSAESIFSVQFNTITTNISTLMFNPSSLGGFASLNGLTSYYDSFNAADTLRRNENIGTIDGSVHRISKYMDPAVAPGSAGRCNFIVLRYADVLLMQSEALNNINPQDATKFDGINKVRTRAGLGNMLLSFSNTATSEDFINALVNERHWEFCVEGVRRLDLIRFKKFQQVKAAQGHTIDDNHLVFPLPQSELDVNANLSQNPGY